jgi:hypothetical protein
LTEYSATTAGKFAQRYFADQGLRSAGATRIHNHFLLFRGEIALADIAGGGRWA